MDDTFTFRGRMPRRRVDPLALKAAVAAALIIAATGVFAKFVIDSERRSVARAAAAAPAATTGTDVAPAFIDPEIDEPARSAAQTALAAAVDTLARGGSPADAGPNELAKLGNGLIFVDGPSTTAQVVSLAAGGDTWAAAVMGASGTCFYARVTLDGVQTFGTGAECTGGDALLAATLPSWDA
jgi:hypothetical protein